MVCCKKRIAIIQSLVPHYREEFYKLLEQSYEIILFSWLGYSEAAKEGFKATGLQYYKLRGFKLGSVIIYNPFSFMFGSYDVMILVQEMKYISHWLVLLLARFCGKRIILWGHGITVLKELTKNDAVVRRWRGRYVKEL